MTATTTPARADRAAPAPVRPSGTAKTKRRSSWMPLWLLLPSAVILIPLFGYPLYQLGLLSFLKFGQPQASAGEVAEFVGFDNYTTLFDDGQFWDVLVQTVVFAAACVVATLAVGAAAAVLLTRVGRWPRL
ncbi:ABC-type sugar transport system permease subunit, partial [Embleya sp. AB8]